MVLQSRQRMALVMCLRWLGQDSYRVAGLEPASGQPKSIGYGTGIYGGGSWLRRHHLGSPPGRSWGLTGGLTGEFSGGFAGSTGLRARSGPLFAQAGPGSGRQTTTLMSGSEDSRSSFTSSTRGSMREGCLEAERRCTFTHSLRLSISSNPVGWLRRITDVRSARRAGSRSFYLKDVSVNESASNFFTSAESLSRSPDICSARVFACSPL